VKPLTHLDVACCGAAGFVLAVAAFVIHLFF